MFTLIFWKQVAERAVKTAGQFVAGVVVADHVGPVANAYSLDWKIIVGAALSGAVLSVATSLGSIPLGSSDSPSLVTTGTAGRHEK